MARLLVIAETDGARLLPTTLPTLTFAQEWTAETGGSFDLLALTGSAVSPNVTEPWRHYGAARLLTAHRPEFAHPVIDRGATAVAQAVRQYEFTALAGSTSAFGRQILAYTAGLLDWPMVSDVMQVQSSEHGLRCRRPTYYGQAIATVQIGGDNAVFAVRGASYGKPRLFDAPSLVSTMDFTTDALPTGTTWRGQERQARMRPDLTQARVVVSGGRPLRDAETFERLLGGLADKLGGAVGASGGAVGAGIAPNELLIGQTGTSVAPDLYIAAGISGSDQHVAGIRESRVIVAINTDPNEPIFKDADYGLVADLHAALPELTDRLSPP